MERIYKNRILGGSILLTAAIVWGIAFVAQSEGMRYMGPFYFNAIRFFMGGTVLLPLIKIMELHSKPKNKIRPLEKLKLGKKTFLLNEKQLLIIGGILCGLILCVANGFQQIALMYSSVGKAGFLTTLYIIMVPVIGIFLRKTPPFTIWISVGMACVGLYLLCFNGTFSLSKGDSFLLICAFLFSIHILVIDYFSPKVNGIKLSSIQFYISSLICLVIALFTETITLDAIVQGVIPLTYAGIMSCGIAYTCQIVGQKYMEPAVASLILSLEAVVSVLAGWIILGQRLSSRELLGCGIVFAAVMLAQLPQKKKKKAATPSVLEAA